MHSFGEQTLLETRAGDTSPLDATSEFTVLLPGWQAQALEQAAHEEGVSAGQFLRRLLSQALLQRQFGAVRK